MCTIKFVCRDRNGLAARIKLNIVKSEVALSCLKKPPKSWNHVKNDVLSEQPVALHAETKPSSKTHLC